MIKLTADIVTLFILGVFSLRDMYEQFQNIMKMGPFGQIMVRTGFLPICFKTLSVYSSWWMVLHCSSVPYTKWKTHKKEMGKILVAREHLNLGVRKRGEKPSWGETRSSGTRGSHPGPESWSVSRGWGSYPLVTRN